ncbi:MAG TPA: sugar transferase [Dermatophilaceae bacterium]|nr:sugar transferase [Dermatophilaceae bacterium]
MPGDGLTVPGDSVKRSMDLLVGVPLLLLSLPVQLVVAVLVAARLGHPVLFRQERIGLHGQPFQLVKFRTMHDADPAGGLDSDAARLTALGRALRAASLDELPSLWHVVRGQMSLVGPRPLLVPYLQRYSPQQARRHQVRPGLTGLAQVNGRNALSWEEKLALDVQYVEQRSVGLDLRILLATVPVVLLGRGVSAPGHATIQEFRGSPGTAVSTGRVEG